MHTIHSSPAIAALAFAASSATAAPFFDDFESYTPGQFPGGDWHDASQRIDNHPLSPAPTSTVATTTDPYGNPTQALLIDEFFGTSQGAFLEIEPAVNHTLFVDVKIDHYAFGTGWPIGIGFIKDEGSPDLNLDPQAVAYAWTDRQFHLWHGGGDITPIDYVLPSPQIQDDAWYRIAVTANTITGVFGAFVIDPITGNTITGGYAPPVPGWIPDTAAFDAIAIYDGESGTGFRGGRAYADNVNYIPTPASALIMLAPIAASTRRRR